MGELRAAHEGWLPAYMAGEMGLTGADADMPMSAVEIER